MNYWLINCIAAFLISVFFAGVLIPQILLVAFRRNLSSIQNFIPLTINIYAICANLNRKIKIF